jgi:hypothetical protein
VQEECRATITDELRWLELQADPAGPHFLGAEFSLVDAVRLAAGPLSWHGFATGLGGDELQELLTRLLQLQQERIRLQDACSVHALHAQQGPSLEDQSPRHGDICSCNEPGMAGATAVVSAPAGPGALPGLPHAGRRATAEAAGSHQRQQNQRQGAWTGLHSEAHDCALVQDARHFYNACR